MAGFSESVEFDVPAVYAFDFLADPSTARVIDPAIREHTPDALPMEVGTRNRIVPTVPLGSPAARLLCRAMHRNATAQQQRFKAEVERRWQGEAG